MQKRGQVTVFVIVGVVVLLAVGIVIYMTNDYSQSKIEETIQTNPDIGAVNEFVQNCVDDIAKEAIVWIGATGGYYDTSEVPSLEGVALYLSEGNTLLPSLASLHTELQKYVDNELQFCINNFEDFPQFEITSTYLKTDADIFDDKV